MENILLVDCDNFFASCEQMFNPELEGKAVCVLGNNDGCVIARSNEAKEMGIPMGLPYFIAKKKFKDAIYVSGNRKKYSEISKKIMKRLLDFTPCVEKYSIDEAFLDIRGMEKFYKISSIQVADKIRKTIKEEFKINVSIGVSKTKTLSKIASEIAKFKVRKKIKDEYEGVFKIDDENREKILSQTKIEDVWGIGRNLHKFFRKHNVRLASDFCELDDDFLKRNLGKRGLELKQELKGNLQLKVIDYYVPPKSVSRTSTFKKSTNSKTYILNELNAHLHEVCKELRQNKLSAGGMSVLLRYKDFRVVVNKIDFKSPKSSEFELYKEMHNLFEELYKESAIYRSSGVIVYKLTPTEDIQQGLFEDVEAKKKRKLSDAWDKIEQKFGYGAINIGIKHD